MIVANKTRPAFTDIGMGASISAKIGANIVVSLAPALQNPNVVPAKIAGNKNEFPRKHKSYVTLTPPFAKVSIIGTKFGYVSLNITIAKWPTKEMRKNVKKIGFRPNL